MIKNEKSDVHVTNVSHMSVFPTFNSLQDVISYGKSRLPINTANDLTNLLMVYHNTLLSQLKK